METKYTLISYNAAAIENHNSDSLDDILSQVQHDHNSWIIIRDCEPSDQADIERLLATFSADIAFAETILNQEPLEISDKVPNCIYYEYSTPTPVFDRQKNDYLQSQGSLIFGEGYLLLFVETLGWGLDDLQQKIQKGRTRVQNFGMDYTLYLLLRAAFNSLDELIDVEMVRRFEKIEDAVHAHPGTKAVFEEILIGRELTKQLYVPLKRFDAFLVDVREEEYAFISEEIRQLFTQNLATDLKTLQSGYLRLRKWTEDLLNIHRANISERTNRIVYILTILSAIFLPITFITSVYGMKFDFMPGVHHPFGFYASVLVMLTIVAGMVVFMKRKDWL